MKKRMSIQLLLVLVLSAGLLSGSLAATGSEGLAADAETDIQSKEWENIMQKQHDLLPKVIEIENILSNAGNEYFGGMYFKGPHAVVQIVERHQKKALETLSTVALPHEISVEKVKYSQRELEVAFEKLTKELVTEDVVSGEVVYEGLWAIDTIINRIVIYSSDERVRSKALEIVNPDMLVFKETVKILDQAGYNATT